MLHLLIIHQIIDIDRKLKVRITEDSKELAMNKMMSNLSSLRTMLHLTQTQFANIIGVSRQTLVSFENGKRHISWSTYLMLVFIFDNNEITKPMLEVLGVFPREFRDFFQKIPTCTRVIKFKTLSQIVPCI